MIKSNRDFKDIIDLKTIKPLAARGHVCVDLTDPLTGKVKERVEGYNHVFTDTMLTNNWIADMASVELALNDSTADIDIDMPFALGQSIGGGLPSNGSIGLYLGAYNSANQVLGAMTTEKVRWKYQYDFTTAQANSGTIGSIYLTNQYISPAKRPISMWGIPTWNTSTIRYTCDGRYKYFCSTAGIITKTDLTNNTTSSIDVSVTVGTTVASIKTVGYNPITGRYYIHVYSATAALRYLYEFSDSIFTTLLNTYSVSNIATSPDNTALYIGGNYMYFFGLSHTTLTYANYVNNLAATTMAWAAANNLANLHGGTNYTLASNLAYNSVAFGKYVVTFTSDTNRARGHIFDLSTGTAVGTLVTPQYASTYQYPWMMYPVIDRKLPCCQYNSYITGVVAAKKLETPITKTTANGMTATYELEVYW